MKTALFLIPCVLFFLFSCSKDDNPVSPGNNPPPPPADTVNTLHSAILSSNTLPDTLYYGASPLTFQVCFSDSDGDAATASLTGLPPRAYNIASSGDSVFVTLNLTADSLAFDSLYSIRITGRGSAAVDTLTLSYSLRVLDSNRVGGIRKFVTGMWWRETAYDTLVSVFDSTGGFSRTIRNTLEHKKTSRVTGLLPVGDTIYYLISTVDTMNSGDSVYANTLLIRHTDSLVEMVLSLNPSFLDSLRVRVLDLPLVIGNAWQTASISVDTAFNVWTYPIRLKALLEGSSAVLDTVRYSFAGANQKCYNITDTFGVSGVWLADTTIRRGNDTLARKGDTVITGWSQDAGYQYYSIGLTVPLFSCGVEVKCDSNRMDQTVKRDTVRSSGRVTEYYDPRTGDTLSLY